MPWFVLFVKQAVTVATSALLTECLNAKHNTGGITPR